MGRLFSGALRPRPRCRAALHLYTLLPGAHGGEAFDFSGNSGCAATLPPLRACWTEPEVTRVKHQPCLAPSFPSRQLHFIPFSYSCFIQRESLTMAGKLGGMYKQKTEKTQSLRLSQVVFFCAVLFVLGVGSCICV